MDSLSNLIQDFGIFMADSRYFISFLKLSVAHALTEKALS